MVFITDAAGRAAATVTPESIALQPRIAVLERDHPVRRWITCQALFAQHVLDQRVAGPYSERRAGLFARTVLMPDEEFCEVADLPDVWLAEAFNVPLPQIAEKREDLRSLAIF